MVNGEVNDDRRKKFMSNQERPGALINKNQVNYVKNVLARGEDGKKTPAEVVKEIYRRNMDNRILNNLRQ
jgi:hypothetical protein